MTQRCLRITAAALALSAVLVLAAPAHAAGRAIRTPGISWIEEVVRWVARAWVANDQPSGPKQGLGIDPNGNPNFGAGIDPNGNPVPPINGFGIGIDPNGAPPDTGGGTDPNG